MTGRRYRLEAPLREWPEGDRPREKLRDKGPRYLTDTELLAILLGTGSGDKNVVDLARDLVKRFGDIDALEAAGVEELTRVPGIGPAKAISIKAALELGRRFVGSAKKGKVKAFRTAEDVADYYLPSMKNLRQEVFKVALLNVKNRVIRTVTISEGGLNSTLVQPRDVFAPAVREGAAGVILAHNHPSGDPAPSADDVNLTRRLADAGDLINIKVLDHIIIGDGDWFSFADAGLL
jgi:DNA repair protein RadC